MFTPEQFQSLARVIVTEAAETATIWVAGTCQPFPDMPTWTVGYYGGDDSMFVSENGECTNFIDSVDFVFNFQHCVNDLFSNDDAAVGAAIEETMANNKGMHASRKTHFGSLRSEQFLSTA